MVWNRTCILQCWSLQQSTSLGPIYPFSSPPSPELPYLSQKPHFQLRPLSAVSAPFMVHAFVQNTFEFLISITLTSWIYCTVWEKEFPFVSKGHCQPSALGHAALALGTTRPKPPSVPPRPQALSGLLLYPVTALPNYRPSLLSSYSSFHMSDPFPPSSISVSFHPCIILFEIKYNN